MPTYTYPYTIEQFGGSGNGTTENQTPFANAVAFLDTLGGGELVFGTGLNSGVYATAYGYAIGNGTNSSASTSGNNIRLIGQGRGHTTLKYIGSNGSGTAVLDFEGPLQNIGARGLTLDCGASTGTDWGLYRNHTTKGIWEDLEITNYPKYGMFLTTRNSSIIGVVSYGEGDHTYKDFYITAPNNINCKGIKMTSGFSTSGNPTFDSCKQYFYGGQIFYGGNSGSYGVLMDAADSNSLRDINFSQRGDSTGAGWDISLQAWAGSTSFPGNNLFDHCSGDANFATGSGLTSHNMFANQTIADGENIPLFTGSSVILMDGRYYKDGVQKI